MTSPDDDDFTAGEYALGTLDREERAVADARRRSEPGFDRDVTAWENRLAPLHEVGVDVVPPAHLWSSILAQIRALQTGAERPSLRVVGGTDSLGRQLRTWKRATAASLALAAALAAWIAVGQRPSPEPGGPLVAVLLKTDESPAFVMQADLREHQISVRPLTAAPVPGKSYELWAIDPELGAPRSLGVVGETGTGRKNLPDLPPGVLSRATYAITIEAAGGSPTGKPTSAPVFFGHLVRTGT